MRATVDGVEVDMNPSDVGFTFSTGDPLDPGAVTGNRSTTIKMTATNRTCALLGGPSMSERTISGSPVLRIQEGGTVYLEQPIRPVQWDRDEVSCVSVGNNAGWITDLKAIKLPEMDLGESPRVGVDLFQSTWDDDDSLLYFPLIDYGYGWDTAVSADIADIRPGLRCHSVLKRAFAQLGYSVKVKGRLRNVWKKYVLPCVNDVKVGERFITENKMSLEQTTDDTMTLTNGDPIAQLPLVVDSITDAGGNNVNTVGYLVPVDMRLEATFSYRIRVTASVFGGGVSFYLYDRNTGLPISAPRYVEMFALATFQSSGMVSLGEHDVTAGTEIGIGIKKTAGISDPSMTIVVEDFAMAITPVNIEYQENVTFDISASAPKVSAWDIISAINYSRCLSFDTDDRTKVVTVSYYADKHRPTAEGYSLLGREDHSAPPAKKDPLKVRRIVYSWKEDDDDHYLTEANDRSGNRLWGGYIKDVEGGTLKEKKIEMPFAATAMRIYPGEVFIPVMRENAVRATPAPPEDDREFKRTPRILLEDGMAIGEWELDGDAQTEYPKCFFVFPGEVDLTMSFYPETLYGSCGPGTIASQWGPYLRRMENSKFLSMGLRLFDDELKGVDFGLPVEVRDEFGTGWYYFTEIKQKRFGRDEPTRCELIQV